MCLYFHFSEKHADCVTGKPIDAANVLNLYAFDVMGDLAFGQPFGMLDKMERHGE